MSNALFAQNLRPLTPGNFVVIQQNIPSGFTAVTVREYTPAGNLVQSLNLSTLTSPNNPLYLSGVGTGETEYGYMSRSANGQYASFGAMGQASATGNRVGALIKYDGTINTATTFTGSSYLVTNATATSSSSSSLTLASNSALIVAGSGITGAGIPSGTTITAFNTGTRVATLSQAATVTSTSITTNPITIELVTPVSNFLPKSVVTDGTGLWMSYSGLSGTANGILYQALNGTGTPTSILASTTGNSFRQMNISGFDNNLYTSRTGQVYNYFSGTPSTTQTSAANPPNATSGNSRAASKGYCFVQPLSGGGEVMYQAVAATSSRAAATNGVTSGSTTVTLSAADANFAVNNFISGPGIPNGTTITANNGSGVLTISQAATSSQSAQVYFTSLPTIGGIYKYYRATTGSAWTAAGSFGTSANNYLSVTAQPKPGGGFTLYAVKYSFAGGSINATATADGLPRVVKIDDEAAYDATMNATESVIVTGSVTRDVFRGISAAPTVAANMAVYYYKGSGNVDDVNSWTNNYDGTAGTSPANFTADNQVFILKNATSINSFSGSSWAVSGANSTIIVGDGFNAVNFVTGGRTVTIGGTAISSSNVNNNSTLNGPVTYYYKGSGAISETSNWATNADGTGSSPSNFSADNHTYIITNAATGVTTISGSDNLTISGTGSALQIGNGTIRDSVILSSGATLNATPVNVVANARFNIQSTAIPSFNTIAATSRIIFGGSVSQTIPTSVNFGRLTLANNNLSIAGGGTINVTDSLNFFVPTTGGTLTIDGTINLIGSSSTQRVVFGASSNASPVVFSINNLTIANTGTGVTLAQQSLANYCNFIISGTLTLTSGNFTIPSQFNVEIDNPIAGTLTNWQNVVNAWITIGGTGSGIIIPSTQAVISRFNLNNANGINLSSPLAIYTTSGFPAVLNLANGVLTTNSNLTVGQSGSARTLNVSRSTGAISGTVTYNATTATNNILTYNTPTPAADITTGVELSMLNDNGNLNLLTINDTSFNVILNSSAANLSGNLSINAGKLVTGANNLTVGGTTTIGALGSLQVSGGTTDFGDRSVTIKSTASGTGSIATISGTLSGASNVTVERYIPFQRGYRTFGHPFTTGQTLAGLNTAFAITGSGSGFNGSSSSSIFRYDSSAVSGSALVGIANSPNTTSSVVWGRGQGLYALVRGSGTQGINFDYTGGKTAATASYTGTINQGALADYALGSVNYTLVGNPYPSAINIKNINSNDDVALSANTSGVYTTIYVYNPYKNAGANDVIRGGFDAYTNDGSTDIIIPSGGAFYVKAKTTGQVLKFTESSKSTSTALSVFGEGSTTPSVKLGIESGKGSWDNVQVSLYKNGTGNATDIYDGEKLNNQLFDLYSLSAEGKRLCIDSRSNNLSSEQIIPLGIRTNVVGTDFKFTVQQNSLPSNAKVVLRDKLLQQEVTLDKDFTGYTFAISSDTATKGNNRFELVINGTAASIVGNPQDQAAIVSFNASPNPFRDVVTVSLDKASTTSTRVSILNILGQSVQSKVVAAGTSNVQFSLSGESAGTYFVRVSTDKGDYTHKIVKQ